MGGEQMVEGDSWRRSMMVAQLTDKPGDIRPMQPVTPDAGGHFVVKTSQFRSDRLMVGVVLGNEEFGRSPEGLLP